MTSEQRLMVDRAGEFSAAEAEQLYDDGARAAAGYLGGYTLSPWSRDGFAVSVRQFGGVLPIWVMHPQTQTQRLGMQEGVETVKAMAELWRPHAGRLVCLDVESGYDHGRPTDRAVIAWRNVVRSHGYRGGLYGGRATIEMVTGLTITACDETGGWQMVWLADWPVHRLDPHLRLDEMPTRWVKMAGHRAWQYAGDVDLGGVVVDLSLVDCALNPMPLAK